jgi:hypothetical protein
MTDPADRPTPRDIQWLVQSIHDGRWIWATVVDGVGSAGIEQSYEAAYNAMQRIAWPPTEAPHDPV